MSDYKDDPLGQAVYDQQGNRVGAHLSKSAGKWNGVSVIVALLLGLLCGVGCYYGWLRMRTPKVKQPVKVLWYDLTTADCADGQTRVVQLGLMNKGDIKWRVSDAKRWKTKRAGKAKSAGVPPGVEQRAGTSAH